MTLADDRTPASSKTSENGVTPILAQNACDLDAVDDGPIAELVQQRLKTMGPMSMLFYRQPLELVRGDGVWLYDAQGSAYLDVYNNVPVLGHGHPAVVEAVSAQMSMLNTHTRYLDRRIHQYSERLLESIALPEGRLVFTCSGSEANDLAIRLAQRCTGKTGVIVSEAAYHGNTHLVTQVSPASYKAGGVPDWVEVLNMEALLLADSDSCPDEVVKPLLLQMEQQLEQAITRLNERGYGCAALLADSVFSSDGVVTHPEQFLAPLVRRVQQQGGWWIADEVQPGFGRCSRSDGGHFWGFQRHQGFDGGGEQRCDTRSNPESTDSDSAPIIPDAVTLGKPMGNGFPVAGLIASHQAFAELNRDVGYFNTFGGSHAAVAAATAVLDVLQQDELPQQAASVGGYLHQQLQRLRERLPAARRVRGTGLFYGLDLQLSEQPSPQDAALTAGVINHLRHHGILIGAAGKAGNVLKIRPALCFRREHVDCFVTGLEEAIGSVYTSMTRAASGF